MVKMGAVWDRTTKFISANTGALATIAFATLIVPSVLADIATVAIVGNDPAAMMANMGTVWIVLFFQFLAMIFGTLAVTALAIDQGLGVGGSLQIALRRLLPAIGIFILAFIALLLLGVPLGIAMGMSGADFANMDAGVIDPSEISGGTVLFMSLYSLTLIPFFMWAFARFSVLTSVIVWERRGIRAFGRAFGLTRGYALRVIGVFILYIIVYLVASLAVVGVFGAIFALVAGGVQGLTVGAVLLSIISAILAAVFSVLYTVFLTKLYKSLIEEAEPAAVFE